MRMLAETAQNEIIQYSKKKLNAFYKTVGSIEKIRCVLPNGIRKMTRTGK